MSVNTRSKMGLADGKLPKGNLQGEGYSFKPNGVRKEQEDPDRSDMEEEELMIRDSQNSEMRKFLLTYGSLPKLVFQGSSQMDLVEVTEP